MKVYNDFSIFDILKNAESKKSISKSEFENIKGEIVSLRNQVMFNEANKSDSAFYKGVPEPETVKFLYHVEVNKNEQTKINPDYNEMLVNSDCAKLMLSLYNKTGNKIAHKEENIKFYKDVLKNNEHLTTIKENIKINKELIKLSIEMILKKFTELVGNCHDTSDKESEIKEYQEKLNSISDYINNSSIDNLLNGKDIEKKRFTLDINNYLKSSTIIKDILIEIIKKYNSDNFILSHVNDLSNSPIILNKIEEHLNLVNTMNSKI
ncbi:hypothetical protein [Proteus columbae]|uniref:hypothetical protein n=1 Tax=Proteus columbae TaxID=1987580 RepID=UPI000C1F4986|nr:hypothetical protein [Proteus columbae]